jgi:hypothetical protein
VWYPYGSEEGREEESRQESNRQEGSTEEDDVWLLLRRTLLAARLVLFFSVISLWLLSPSISSSYRPATSVRFPAGIVLSCRIARRLTVGERAW